MTIAESFREWDELDFLAAGGMLVLASGVVAPIFPRFRKIEVLLPIAIGAAMMAIAAFGARHGNSRGFTDEAGEADAAQRMRTGTLQAHDAGAS